MKKRRIRFRKMSDKAQQLMVNAEICYAVNLFSLAIAVETGIQKKWPDWMKAIANDVVSYHHIYYHTDWHEKNEYSDMYRRKVKRDIVSTILERNAQ